MTLQNINNQASQLNQKQIQILKKINKNFQQQYDEMLKDMYEKIVTPYINFSFTTKDVKMKNINDALQFIQQNTKTIESTSITQILTQYKQQSEQQAPKAVQFTNHIQNSLINYIPYPVLNINKQNKNQNQSQDETPITPLQALKTLIQQPIIKPFVPFASKSDTFTPQQEFLIPKEAENEITQIYDNYQLKDIQTLHQKAQTTLTIDSQNTFENQQQISLLTQQTFTKRSEFTNETQKFINFIEKNADVIDFDTQIRNEAKISLRNSNYENLLNFIKNKNFNEKIIEFINENLFNLFDIQILSEKQEFSDFIQKIQNKQILSLSAFYNKQTFFEGISVLCVIDDSKVYFIDCNALINEIFMLRGVFQDQNVKKLILNKNWQKVIDKMMLQWRICIQGALSCQQTFLGEIEDIDMSFRPIEQKVIQDIINVNTKQIWYVKYEGYNIQSVKYHINIDYQSQIDKLIQNINLAGTVQEMNYQMFLFWCEVNCRLFNLNNNFEISKQDFESFIKTNKISHLNQLPSTIKLHLIEINELLAFSLEYFKSHQQNKTVQQVRQTFIPSKKYQFTNKSKTDFTDCLQKLGVFVESSASLDSQNMKDIMDQFIQLNSNMADTLLIDQQIKQNKQENDMAAFNASINEINNLLGVDRIDVDELFKEYIK